MNKHINRLKVVMLSDTHNAHRELTVPEGDILIHAGDATDDGTEGELLGFFQWFQALPHREKVYIPGNHDMLFSTDYERAMALVPAGVFVPIGTEAYLPISGLSIFGAPWSRWNTSLEGTSAGAFALRDIERAEAWGKLSGYVDIVISHSPPWVISGEGGDDLVDKAIERHKPRLLICGHIHRYRGVKAVGHSGGEKTIVVNAACVDDVFQVLAPITVEI